MRSKLEHSLGLFSIRNSSTAGAPFPLEIILSPLRKTFLVTQIIGGVGHHHYYETCITTIGPKDLALIESLMSCFFFRETLPPARALHAPLSSALS